MDTTAKDVSEASSPSLPAIRERAEKGMSTTIHLQVEGAEIILFDVRNREPNCIAVLDAAAALELAERLKTTALKIQAENENAFTALYGH